MHAGQGDQRRGKRARRGTEVAADATSSSERAGESTAHRPTAAESQEALEVIHMMKEREPPIVPRRGQPPKPNVVACAIAMYRGERFESDASALKLFGVAPDTKVRGVWVDGKLAEIAPAGLGTPGEPALPTYLLDRGEPAEQPPAASPPADDESSGEEDSADRKEARRHERRVDAWACDGAAQDAAWRREQDEAKARRAREAGAWDAAHGADREAQHAALLAERPLDVYWALAYEIGRRPKWRLRKGAYLEADATRTIAQDEQLLLYRAFRPFRADGNLVKALHVLAGSLLDPDLIEWRDAESAMLPDLQEKTTRAREQHECQSPPADHPTRADPYAHGGSMDCHFVGAADHARLEQRAQYDLLAQALLAKAFDCCRCTTTTGVMRTSGMPSARWTTTGGAPVSTAHPRATCLHMPRRRVTGRRRSSFAWSARKSAGRRRGVTILAMALARTIRRVMRGSEMIGQSGTRP